MEELKNLYSKILSLTKSLEYYIEKQNTEKINAILEQRINAINIVLELKEKLGTDKEIEELASKIKALDKKNFEKLKKLKLELGKEIYGLTKNTKAVSAYKAPEQMRSRLINETDI